MENSVILAGNFMEMAAPNNDRAGSANNSRYQRQPLNF